MTASPLVALALQAKNLSGEGMGGGLAIAAMFICLWSPVVLLSGHVVLLVDRLETRRLLVVVSLAQAAVAVVLALVGSVAALLALAMLLGAGIAIAQGRSRRSGTGAPSPRGTACGTPPSSERLPSAASSWG